MSRSTTAMRRRAQNRRGCSPGILVALKPEVIVAAADMVAIALQRETRAIPIVFGAGQARCLLVAYRS